MTVLNTEQLDQIVLLRTEQNAMAVRLEINKNTEKITDIR